ncbi:hypothetical protein EG68_11005 [Paragonimus skrjabini miyazakii]|uniref:Serine/threonine-protein kinase 19 n=1 Tax=Paragonimus skrjabini miyazakii TaxID=59628 RepID=A0A8S9YJ03_9TREM|nr:hypothetical protein EG68_11005 [Paragonimus skrjabini miyazakii]
MKRRRNGQIIPSEKHAVEMIRSIPSFQTVDEALQFSFDSFPSVSFNPPLRPILVKSQIYAVVANRNSVDSQLMRMQNDGKIRMLKLEDETDETLAIMRSEDYAASFRDVGVSDIDDTTVFERFCNWTLNDQRSLSVNKPTLLQQFTDKQITRLIQGGALTIRSVDLWWISSPCLGRFLKAYKAGQRALLALVRRQKFKELLLSSIATRGLGGSGTCRLGYLYHVLAHVGAGTLISVPTTSGPLIRLRTG